jgi:hypothetical protein
MANFFSHGATVQILKSGIANPAIISQQHQIICCLGTAQCIVQVAMGSNIILLTVAQLKYTRFSLKPTTNAQSRTCL